MKSIHWMTVAGLAMAALVSAAPAGATDLQTPEGQIEAYVRANGDTTGAPRWTYGMSTVYAMVPGEKARPLFNLEIVGVSRYEKIAGGYARLHREIGYYTDLKTGAVLTTWQNPYTGRTVDVMPIQNDPVNRKFVVDPKTGASGIRIVEQGDWTMMYREVPLRYPNVLTRAEYPQYSSGDWYEAMELFNTFVKTSDMQDATRTSVPASGSWSRVGPWLPWMEMGNSQGQLVYHGRSVKFDAVDGLPRALREHTARHHPKFLEAPTEYSESSATSWTVFREQIDARRGQQKPR